MSDELVVLPVPTDLRRNGARFAIDARTVVVAPSAAAEDLAAAEYLAHALQDETRLGVAVAVGKAPAGSRAILVGTCGDACVAEAAKRLGVRPDEPGPEGYVLEIGQDGGVVVGSDRAGALYGCATLLELLRREGLSYWIEGATVRDRPAMPVRAVHVFIPGKDQIPYFDRYLERLLVRHKYNTVIMECSGAMRLRSHPDISAGWPRLCDELYADGEFIWQYGEGVPLGPGNRFQNSIHRGCGYAGIIEREDLAGIAARCRRRHVRIIPELQSLSHSYYLASIRPELAEIPEAKFPDTMCPLHPDYPDLVRDIMDEYIDAIGFDAVHIGHDEWRAGGKCPRCRDKDTGELFAQDVIRLWTQLKERDVDLWMWGDHFVAEHTEKRAVWQETWRKDWPTVNYDYPSTVGARAAVGAATAERPITITHWSYGKGPQTDRQLLDAGFNVVFGNFAPRNLHATWAERRAQPRIIGAEVSSWCALEEFELGKMHCLEAVYGSTLMWSERLPEVTPLYRAVLDRAPQLKARLVARRPASDWAPIDERLRPLDLGAAASTPLAAGSWDLSALAGRSGTVGRVPWRFGTGCAAVRRPEDEASQLPLSVELPISGRVQGLVFWHCTSGPGGKRVHAGDATFFPRESSDLVALYEVVYVDGRIDCVECRFRENIDCWDGGEKVFHYHAPHHLVASQGDGKAIVVCGHEWTNPRRDIPIARVVLRGCPRRVQECDAPLAATLLLGVSAIDVWNLADCREARMRTAEAVGAR